MNRTRKDTIEKISIAGAFLLFGFLLAAIGPTYLFSYWQAITIVAVFIAGVGVLGSLTVVFFGKRLISRFLKLTADQMDDLVSPASEAVQSALDGRRSDATKKAEQFVKALYGKYLWSSVRGHALTVIYGSVAAIAGFATTFLLLQQNDLLKIQNEKLDAQNRLVDAQLDLARGQTELLSRQTEISLTATLSENSVSVRQLFDEIVAEQRKAPTQREAHTGSIRDATTDAEKKQYLIEAFRHKQLHKLSPALSVRLGFVTASLQPYSREIADSKAARRSAERGQVLLALHHLNVDLSNEVGSLNLDYMDLLGSSAIGLELAGIEVENASFSKADLRLSVFAICQIKGADFRAADLRMSTLTIEIPRGNGCYPCTFRNCDFSETDFRFSVINADFVDCRFTNANFSGCIVNSHQLKVLRQQEGFDTSRWTERPVADPLTINSKTKMVRDLYSSYDMPDDGWYTELVDRHATNSDNVELEDYLVPNPPWAHSRIIEP